MNPGVVLTMSLLLSMSTGARPVYKCEEKGHVTYTDRPCPAQAQARELPGLTVTAPPGPAERDLARAWDERLARSSAERDRNDAEWLKQHHNRRDREARVRKAILEHKVIKSMTFAEVKQALGEPDQVESGDSFGTDKATWIYLADGSRRTVNFKDGEVTSTAKKGKRSR